MLIYETAIREVKLIRKIICDKCGKEVDIDEDFEIQEFTHIRDTGGYSSVFGDGVPISYDICQHCLYDFLK